MDPPRARTIGKRSWLDTRPFELSGEQRWHIAQFLLGLNRGYERGLQQQLFYRSLVGQVLHGAPRRAGCDWQHRGVTVSSRGELMYCAVQSNILGNAKLESAESLYFENHKHLEEIVRDKCAQCAHDYVGPPGGYQQLALYLGQLRESLGLGRERVKSLPGYGLVIAARKLRNDLSMRRERRTRMAFPTAGGSRGGKSGAVVICGWYGTETLGDKAILAAIVGQIRKLAPLAPILVASLEPKLTQLTVAEMPELSGCEVVSADAVDASVAVAKALVFGGGPLMAVRQMSTMERLFSVAASNGVPSIVAGCGVGPVGTRSFRESICALLDSAAFRIYRDSESKQLASDLGVETERDLVSEDPAFTWIAASRIDRLPRTPSRRPVLALGLRSWPSGQYAGNLATREARQIDERFQRELLDALELLLSRIPTLTIRPIPFCTHDSGGDDRLVYWAMSQRSGTISAAMDCSGISRDLGPGYYRDAIHDADALLAMRFHSIVFGRALGTPTVAIDYTLGSGKSAALCRRHEISCFSLEALKSEQLADALALAISTERKSPNEQLTFGGALEKAWSACAIPAFES
jgi:polysaccharide pyruvyl transferase WcaK-like protein